MATTTLTESSTESTAKTYPIYVAGEWHTSDDILEIRSPYSGELVGITYQASKEQLEQAIVGARGPASFQVALIHALHNLDDAALAKGVRFQRGGSQIFG